MSNDGSMRTRDYVEALLARASEDGTADPANRAGVEFVTTVTRVASRLVQDFDQIHREAGIS